MSSRIICADRACASISSCHSPPAPILRSCQFAIRPLRWSSLRCFSSSFRRCGWRIVVLPRFPFLLRFCDEQSGHSVYPFPCYPGPPAPTWRRPFHSCGVPYPQAPTLDRDSLTATIAEFMHVGPHPRRLDGAPGASHSSAPFRNRSEAFDTASPS
jgi:hypothetical protein